MPAERLPELSVFWRRMLWLAAPFTILYLSNAMAPEASPDGSSYHLGLVARYYREHAMAPVTTNMYAALSQGMEMLFLSAYAVGRHSAAAMVHFTYLLALPWLMICFGRRYAMPGAGVTAALLKSKRRRFSSTEEPCCAASAETTSCKAQWRRWVAVW